MFFISILIWIVALLPWMDYAIRGVFPAALGSMWDEVLIIIIVIAIYIYQCVREEPQHRRDMIPQALKWAFFVLIIFTVGSIVVNAVPLAVSFDAVRVMFQPMLFILLTMYMLDNEELLDNFVHVLIGSTVIIALLGIVQYVFQVDTTRFMQKDGSEYRIISIFSNPNALGAYFNMVLAFLIALFLFSKGWRHKLFYFSLITPIVIGLVLTFSRGAWIAFAVMLIFLIAIYARKWLLALIPIIIALPFIMPDSVINRFMNLFDPEYYRLSSEYGRISFWRDAIEKTLHKPIFGQGLGTYGDSVPLRHNIPFSTWVDNHYLKLGAEIGIFGLVAAIAILVILLLFARHVYRAADTDKYRAYILGATGAIITMIVQNGTASIWEVLVNAITFYAIVGMLLGISWYQHEQALIAVESVSSQADSQAGKEPSN